MKSYDAGENPLRCGSCHAMLINYNWDKHTSNTAIESSHIICPRCKKIMENQETAFNKAAQEHFKRNPESKSFSIMTLGRETYGRHDNEIIDCENE